MSALNSRDPETTMASQRRHITVDSLASLPAADNNDSSTSPPLTANSSERTKAIEGGQNPSSSSEQQAMEISTPSIDNGKEKDTAEIASKRPYSVVLKEPPSKKTRGTEIEESTDSQGSNEVNSSVPPASFQVSTAPPETRSPLPSTSQGTQSAEHVLPKSVRLDPIPEVPPLPILPSRQKADLEAALQIGDKFVFAQEHTWREDWNGNVQLALKEIVVNGDRLLKFPHAKPETVLFLDLVSDSAKDPDNLTEINWLFSHVYHMAGTPPTAKKILAYALRRQASSIAERTEFIREAIRRVCYDPVVLREDGWTTKKAPNPEGASGGAYLIGRRVIWERHEAVVIAFVNDEDIGDLWKAVWLLDDETFDLEADELQTALKRYEKREAAKVPAPSVQKQAKGAAGKANRPKGASLTAAAQKQQSSARFAASSNVKIEGIELGIVLATSMDQRARAGVPWPARIMNVSEAKGMHSQSGRRSSVKALVHAVFLAPYWNNDHVAKPRLSDAQSSAAEKQINAGKLFQVEVIEVSETAVKKYPYDDGADLSIHQLRSEFRFLGLPKAVFSRYVNSHRLAVAFKAFARQSLKGKQRSSLDCAGLDSAFAALSDTHPLAVQAPSFPSAALELPFEFILSHLPGRSLTPPQYSVPDAEDETEQVLQLRPMLEAMIPPVCWGGTVASSFPTSATTGEPAGAESTSPAKGNKSVLHAAALSSPNANEAETEASIRSFTSELLLKWMGPTEGKMQLAKWGVSRLLEELVRRVEMFEPGTEDDIPFRKAKLAAVLRHCLAAKGHGEDIVREENADDSVPTAALTLEWRKACERIMKRALVKFSTPGLGDGVTAVLSDSACNLHLTSTGSYERAVRLPAAIRGAKLAGAGANDNMPLLNAVDPSYLLMAEKVIRKAHKDTYLKRLKSRVAQLQADAKGEPLTEDDDGEGGEDTMGSRGSYDAAVAAVASALWGANMVASGQCVNAFCAVRPPGHHAGRELHPMNAMSNGFCLLNSVACAAIYATMPRSEGGLGMKRVCVLDFDVHHGNGTQDILCSTHDSRFLYVSTHAGGAHINGSEANSDDENDAFRRLGGGKSDGIFPGRCGDTSPHPGVLNIPMGAKVTPHEMGNALVCRVSPEISKFAPDLIILSAGFDAHKNDPLGMGGLSATDFGTITDVACQIAHKSCGGRVLSVLEGGYGVPCCRQPRENLFLPQGQGGSTQQSSRPGDQKKTASNRILDLGGDLPETMEDEVMPQLFQKLDKCHSEGFLDCVREHVASLARYSDRSGRAKS